MWPFAASEREWQMSLLPVTKPPPWIHTITGRLSAPRPRAGVQTLRVRQFSLVGLRTWGLGPVSGSHAGPGLVGSSVPDHFAAGRGGCHRNGPTGGAAYGMP